MREDEEQEQTNRMREANAAVRRRGLFVGALLNRCIPKQLSSSFVCFGSGLDRLNCSRICAAGANELML